MRIYDYLRHGKANLRTTKELRELTGMTTRAICKSIERDRVCGNVILSSPNGGYWLPDESEPDIKEQLEKYIRFMWSKAPIETVKSAEDMLKRLQGDDQLHIEL